VSAPLLEARSLRFAVPAREILSQLSLEVREGELVALLGPNGSGKTTLLRCLGGLLRPSSGEVLLDGAPLLSRSRPEIACRLAYLPQNTWTEFDVSVFDAVALGRFPHLGAWRALTRRDSEAIHGAMAQVGIEALARRTLPTLSAGERQRVFIARALAQGSPLLLLDEPTSSLDIGHQIELVEILGRLHAEGKTIVAALHDLNLALEFFPRAILLDRGRKTADGETRAVLRSPSMKEAFGVEMLEGTELRFRRAGAAKPG
jgi:ABC-type cobalamin/Fe3+-siderophores transport system ATPase subunit